MIESNIGNSNPFQNCALTEIAPQAACSISLTLVSSPEALDGSLDKLENFFREQARDHQAFQCPQFLRMWSRHYLRGGASQLVFVVGWKHSEPVMFVPFVKSSYFGVNVLQWAGMPIAQFGDAVIGSHSKATEAITSALRFAAEETGADLFHLRKVREDATIAQVLRELGAQPTNEMEAPFVDLKRYGGDDEYYRRYSSKKRKQRRRRQRQLDEQGKIKFENLPAGPKAAEQAANAIRAKRKSLGFSAHLSALDSRFEQFFVDFCGDTISSISPRVSVLKSEDRVVAQEIGIVFKGHYFAHVGAFDQEYKRFAPGTLQMDRTILQCIADRMRTYDMLAPSSAYKTDFADGNIAVTDYALHCTPKGALYSKIILQETVSCLRSMRDLAMRKR